MCSSWVSYMEGKMDETSSFGNCKLVDVVPTEDGGAKYIFEMDDMFKETYCKLYYLSEFSEEHFNKTFLDTIQFIVNRAEEQRLKSSEFLWSTPKENNE